MRARKNHDKAILVNTGNKATHTRAPTAKMIKRRIKEITGLFILPCKSTIMIAHTKKIRRRGKNIINIWWTAVLPIKVVSISILYTPKNKKVRSRSHALKKCTTPNAATHLFNANQVQKERVHFLQNKMHLLARCLDVSQHHCNKNKKIVNAKKKSPVLYRAFLYLKTNGTTKQNAKRNTVNTEAERIPESRNRNLPRKEFRNM